MTRNPYLVSGMLVSFEYKKPGEQPTHRTGFVNEQETTDKVLNIRPDDCYVTPFKSFRWSNIENLMVH
jgi:hypothetical protein